MLFLYNVREILIVNLKFTQLIIVCVYLHFKNCLQKLILFWWKSELNKKNLALFHFHNLEKFIANYATDHWSLWKWYSKCKYMTRMLLKVENQRNWKQWCKTTQSCRKIKKNIQLICCMSFTSLRKKIDVMKMGWMWI